MQSEQLIRSQLQASKKRPQAFQTLLNESIDLSNYLIRKQHHPDLINAPPSTIALSPRIKKRTSFSQLSSHFIELRENAKIEVSSSANNLDNIVPSKKITLYSFKGLESTLDQKNIPLKAIKKLTKANRRSQPGMLPPICSKTDLSIDTKSPNKQCPKVPRITPKQPVGSKKLSIEHKNRAILLSNSSTVADPYSSMQWATPSFKSNYHTAQPQMRSESYDYTNEKDQVKRVATRVESFKNITKRSITSIHDDDDLVCLTKRRHPESKLTQYIISPLGQAGTTPSPKFKALSPSAPVLKFSKIKMIKSSKKQIHLCEASPQAGQISSLPVDPQMEVVGKMSNLAQKPPIPVKQKSISPLKIMQNNIRSSTEILMKKREERVEKEQPLKHLVRKKEISKTGATQGFKQNQSSQKKNPFKVLPFLNKPYIDVLDLDTVFYRRIGNVGGVNYNLLKK